MKRKHKNVQGVQALRWTIALIVPMPTSSGNAGTASELKAQTGTSPTVFTPLFAHADLSESVRWPR